MKWKSKPNFPIALILSLAYSIVTLLNIIGPLHMNAQGNINQPGALSLASFFYFLVSLGITWGLYAFLRKKPEVLFFTLIIVGIFLIFLEIFLWGWMGSSYIAP